MRIYYQQKPGGAAVDVRLGKKKIGEFATDGPVKSKVYTLKFSPLKAKAKLKLRARGKNARLYGISFEKGGGLLYESIGPVGADAKVLLAA